jgi:hypothetical protein
VPETQLNQHRPVLIALLLPNLDAIKIVPDETGRRSKTSLTGLHTAHMDDARETSLQHQRRIAHAVI